MADKLYINQGKIDWVWVDDKGTVTYHLFAVSWGVGSREWRRVVKEEELQALLDQLVPHIGQRLEIDL